MIISLVQYCETNMITMYESKHYINNIWNGGDNCESGNNDNN